MKDRDELSRRLWLLREQMEQLVCALEIQQLVLLNHRYRWLPMVSENVEQIIGDISLAEHERVVVARRVSREFGLPESASLAELASAAEDPYGAAWRQSRHQLLALQAEVDELATENKSLTRQGSMSVSDAMRHLTGDGLDKHDTYDPKGSVNRLSPVSSHFDRTA